MAAQKPPPLKIDVEEFFAATRFLTDRQAQAYLRLRCYLWENGTLPMKREDRAGVAQLDLETFATMEAMLAATFDRGEGGEWRDFALEEKREAAIAGRSKMFLGGRQGGLKKAENEAVARDEGRITSSPLQPRTTGAA